MRLLHTSDWHVGKILRNVRRRPDHEATLAQLVSIANEEQPDVILHTGDLFDSFRPEYDDVQFALDVLRDLAAVAPTLVLAGNHDSPALFRVFRQLLETGNGRLRFIDKARKPSDGGVLRYPIGEHVLRVAPLPYYAPRDIDRFEDASTWAGTYSDKIGTIERVLGDGLLQDYNPKRDVLVFAGHLHVRGALMSNSERESHVGENYEATLDATPAVSYAAFGHIHRPQKLPTPRVLARYAGSLLPVDFGESDDKKSVVVVDVSPGAPAQTRLVPITAGRRLEKVRGTEAVLRSMAATIGDAIIEAIVISDEPLPYHADLIRDIFPQATIVRTANDCAASRVSSVDEVTRSGEEASLPTLFREYLSEQPVDGIDADFIASLFGNLERTVEDEVPPRLIDLTADSEATA
ncbi:MAG TPA: exonuclease subunit SbcD [Candidatus Baltobacteraceae bacterium]